MPHKRLRCPCALLYSTWRSDSWPYNFSTGNIPAVRIEWMAGWTPRAGLKSAGKGYILPFMGSNHEFWVFQPAAQLLYWLSYTDSKQFYMEIKNWETPHVIIFYVPLLLTFSWALDNVPITGKERSEFPKHTHIITTHFRVLYCSGFQKQKRIIQNSEQRFVFRYIIVQIRAFNMMTTRLIPIHWEVNLQHLTSCVWDQPSSLVTRVSDY
jgi:hypothetical protein